MARGRPDAARMLFLGRITMLVAMLVAVFIASANMDVLTLLVIAGGLWGTIVFPVIASVYWTRVTNTAFSTAVIVALLAYVVARFEIVPLSSPALYVLETFSIVGGGVVVGLMTFAFLGRRAGLVVGAVVAVALAPFFWGFVRDYAELFAVTVAYGLSTVLCVGITLASRHEFDFDTIKDNVTAFQAGTTADPELTRAEGAG